MFISNVILHFSLKVWDFMEFAGLYFFKIREDLTQDCKSLQLILKIRKQVHITTHSIFGLSYVALV